MDENILIGLIVDGVGRVYVTVAFIESMRGMTVMIQISTTKFLSRLDTQRLYRSDLRYDELDYWLDPFESGMKGCPWRIMASAILSIHASVEDARHKMKIVMELWPTPELLGSVRPERVAGQLFPMTRHGRRARALVGMSKVWVSDDWETIIDLPGVCMRVARVTMCEMERYHGCALLQCRQGSA